MIGRAASIKTSSLSVNSLRFGKAPPSDRRHNQSDISWSSLLKLSNTPISVRQTEIARSSTDFGRPRTLPRVGSIESLSILPRVVLPLPCSPMKIMIGYGPRRISAAIKKPSISTKRSSVGRKPKNRARRWTTLRRDTAGAGSGRGLAVALCTRCTGGSTMIDQPFGPISIARGSGVAMSMKIRSPPEATRRNTSRVSPRRAIASIARTASALVEALTVPGTWRPSMVSA
jgi:hypothetical protein